MNKMYPMNPTPVSLTDLEVLKNEIDGRRISADELRGRVEALLTRLRGPLKHDELASEPIPESLGILGELQNSASGIGYAQGAMFVLLEELKRLL